MLGEGVRLLGMSAKSPYPEKARAFRGAGV